MDNEAIWLRSQHVCKSSGVFAQPLELMYASPYDMYRMTYPEYDISGIKYTT